MIPRFKPDFRWSDIASLLPRAGDDVANFERAFAQLAGQKEAVAFGYGRTALMMLLYALKLKEKHKTEVICPSYSCVVVPHAIMLSGHVPVLVDVAAGGYNMDWDYVEQATNENTGAVIATSIFGMPVDLAALERYRARHPDVVILQDCAHSFMAEDGGRPVQQAGAAAFYGLNISKLITSIFGGMVTTNDAALARELRALRAARISPPTLAKALRRGLYAIAAYVAFMRVPYGAVHWLERHGFLARFATYYDPALIDLPADAYIGMTNLEARIGRVQCGRYQAIIDHRRKLARLYLDGLCELEGLVLPDDAPGATWSHFTVRTPQAQAIIAACRKQGIQLGELIEYDIADMPAYRDARYVGQHRARAYVGQVMNLPVHVGVSEADVRRVMAVIALSLRA